MDETPDVPLQNFGGETEVAAPPAAEEAQAPEQTAQQDNATGSDDQQAQPEQSDVNSIAEEQQRQDGRPEKRDRLQERFGELTGKVKQQDEYIQQLEAQFQRNQAMQQVQPLQADENGYVDPQALQQQQAQIAQAYAQSEVQQLRAQIERETVANRYNDEGAKIVERYKADFEASPIHQEIIENLIQERVSDNINNLNVLKKISPMKIAENYMKGIEAERRKAQSTATTNLQTLQSQAAVNSDGAAPGPSADDALEARVADIKF
jgi:hypothetical protein